MGARCGHSSVSTPYVINLNLCYGPECNADEPLLVRNVPIIGSRCWPVSPALCRGGCQRIWPNPKAHQDGTRAGDAARSELPRPRARRVHAPRTTLTLGTWVRRAGSWRLPWPVGWILFYKALEDLQLESEGLFGSPEEPCLTSLSKKPNRIGCLVSLPYYLDFCASKFLARLGGSPHWAKLASPS
jgi:hypothetical protein